jgi:hypothetical protein
MQYGIEKHEQGNYKRICCQHIWGLWLYALIQRCSQFKASRHAQLISQKADAWDARTCNNIKLEISPQLFSAIP